MTKVADPLDVADELLAGLLPALRSAAQPNANGVASQGPIGPKPGSDLPRLNCGGVAAICSVPSEMSCPTACPRDIGQRLVDRYLERAPADDRDRFDFPVGVASLSFSTSTAVSPAIKTSRPATFAIRTLSVLSLVGLMQLK